jgi:hypothetical protein
MDAQDSAPEVIGFDESMNPIYGDGQSAPAGTDGSDKAQGELTEHPPMADSGEQFMPPEEVAPGLEESHKLMQARFTKGMQEIAGIKKHADEWRQKAAAFDALMQDPAFQQTATGGGGQSQPVVRDPGAPAGYEGEQEPELDPAARAYLDKRLAAIENEVRRTQVNQQVAEFVKDHPDWPEYQAAMVQVWRKNPHLSPLDAYNLAKAPLVQTEVQQLRAQLEALRGRQRKSLTMETGRVQGGVEKQEAPESIGEAGRRALERLRAQGLKFH